MELSGLYNELSSKVRLTILGMLRDGMARFSDIVKKVELSSPEVSRHLKRLQDANLVEKRVEGGYKLSLFGDTVLRMTANMEPLMDKSEYFMTHDTSAIPNKLLRELESMEGANPENVWAMMGALYSKIPEAEFFWDIALEASSADSSVFDTLNIEELELELRFLSTRDVLDAMMAQARNVNVKYQARVQEHLGFSVTVLNNTAMLALPDRNGVIDRNAYLIGESTEYIDWCKRLYLHYWDNAEMY